MIVVRSSAAGVGQKNAKTGRRKKQPSEPKGFIYMLAISYIVTLLICPLILASGLAQKREKVLEAPRSSYDRWHDLDSGSGGSSYGMMEENEIDTGMEPTNNDHNQPTRAASQKDYGCGRALALQKPNRIIEGLSDLAGTTRNKYRPIEIRMPRIIGGHETAPGEFPWTASIKLNGQPICGGSLIDRSWILTAAHCVVGYNPKNLTVRLGSYRIKDLTEVQSIELAVDMFIVHKEYSLPRLFSNDIALLKLSDLVQYTDYILPVCLPYEDQVGNGQMGSLGASSNTMNNNHNHNNHISNHNNLNDDYNMHLLEHPGDQLLAEPADSLGIVVSTKMSDVDIAKCFNRLEQNYLNSIGMGTMSDGSDTLLDDPTRYAGLNGIVVGWGWVKEQETDEQTNNNNNSKGSPSVTLQKVRLPILRNKVCESWFQSQSKKITLLPSQFCAGFQAGGKDACRGDSGGPMIIEDSSYSGRYKLIGIVSAGIGCARPSLPGLYTRVASFLPWITSQINRH